MTSADERAVPDAPLPKVVSSSAPDAPGAGAPPGGRLWRLLSRSETSWIPNRVVLAPMAGLTSSAYRRHLKTHGAGLVITEMVSAYGLLHRNVRTGEYLDFAEEERPLAVQLFGDTPEVMARAAEMVLDRRARGPTCSTSTWGVRCARW